MTVLGTAPLPATTDPATGDDDLHHLVCCRFDPLTAVCGVDLTGTPFGWDGLPCVVCYDLARHPCEHCNRGHGA